MLRIEKLEELTFVLQIPFPTPLGYNIRTAFPIPVHFQNYSHLNWSILPGNQKPVSRIPIPDNPKILQVCTCLYAATVHSKLGPWNCLIASKQMDLWSTSSGEFKIVLFCSLPCLQWSVLSNVTETGCIECLTCGKSGQNSTCMLHG